MTHNEIISEKNTENMFFIDTEETLLMSLRNPCTLPWAALTAHFTVEEATEISQGLK